MQLPRRCFGCYLALWVTIQVAKKNRNSKRILEDNSVSPPQKNDNNSSASGGSPRPRARNLQLDSLPVGLVRPRVSACLGSPRTCTLSPCYI